MLERPGRHYARREKIEERGERLYARWGRLAVFVTPAIVTGTAKMPPYQFAVWNLLDSLGWTGSVAASACAIGSPPHHGWHDIAVLVIGLGIGRSSPSWSCGVIDGKRPGVLVRSHEAPVIPPDHLDGRGAVREHGDGAEETMGSMAQQAPAVSGRALRTACCPVLVRDDDAAGLGMPSAGARRGNGRGA